MNTILDPECKRIPSILRGIANGVESRPGPANLVTIHGTQPLVAGYSQEVVDAIYTGQVVILTFSRTGEKPPEKLLNALQDWINSQ